MRGRPVYGRRETGACERWAASLFVCECQTIDRERGEEELIDNMSLRRSSPSSWHSTDGADQKVGCCLMRWWGGCACLQ